jgi:hypothetical protein
MKTIAIGEKNLSHDAEAVSVMVRKVLSVLKPRLILSDLSPGWNITVADSAIRYGIPVMGVFPHAEVFGNKAHIHLRNQLLKNINTSIVFSDTYLGFLKAPQEYVKWVLKNTESALCYINTEHSSPSHSLMVACSTAGKTTHNLFKEN